MVYKKVVQKIVAAGVVFDNDKILIIQRANNDSFPGLWEIPSGKREPFESTKTAVIREVKEETGLDVNVKNPIDVFEFKTEKETEIRDTTQISFLATLTGNKEVCLSKEHQNFIWINKVDIEKYNISPETKIVLTKAFENLKKLS